MNCQTDVSVICVDGTVSFKLSVLDNFQESPLFGYINACDKIPDVLKLDNFTSSEFKLVLATMMGDMSPIQLDDYLYNKADDLGLILRPYHTFKNVNNKRMEKNMMCLDEFIRGTNDVIIIDDDDEYHTMVQSFKNMSSIVPVQILMCRKLESEGSDRNYVNDVRMVSIYDGLPIIVDNDGVCADNEKRKVECLNRIRLNLTEDQTFVPENIINIKKNLESISIDEDSNSITVDVNKARYISMFSSSGVSKFLESCVSSSNLEEYDVQDVKKDEISDIIEDGTGFQKINLAKLLSASHIDFNAEAANITTTTNIMEDRWDCHYYFHNYDSVKNLYSQRHQVINKKILPKLVNMKIYIDKLLSLIEEKRNSLTRWRFFLLEYSSFLKISYKLHNGFINVGTL